MINNPLSKAVYNRRDLEIARAVQWVARRSVAMARIVVAVVLVHVPGDSAEAINNGMRPGLQTKSLCPYCIDCKCAQGGCGGDCPVATNTEFHRTGNAGLKGTGQAWSLASHTPCDSSPGSGLESRLITEIGLVIIYPPKPPKGRRWICSLKASIVSQNLSSHNLFSEFTIGSGTAAPEVAMRPILLDQEDGKGELLYVPE